MHRVATHVVADARRYVRLVKEELDHIFITSSTRGVEHGLAEAIARLHQMTSFQECAQLLYVVSLNSADLVRSVCF